MSEDHPGDYIDNRIYLAENTKHSANPLRSFSDVNSSEQRLGRNQISPELPAVAVTVGDTCSQSQQYISRSSKHLNFARPTILKEAPTSPLEVLPAVHFIG